MARIDEDSGLAALAKWRTRQVTSGPESAWARSEQPDPEFQWDRQVEATAVRYTLQLLSERAPGNSVEVRVIPFGAVQIIEGANHRRGTPPAVIEMDSETWLELASGQQTWDQALDTGTADASGERADLSSYLPLF